jgi:hypothetical protein
VNRPLAADPKPPAAQCACADAQAVQVLQVAAMRLGARCDERLGAVIGAGEAQHSVAGGDQIGDDGGADEWRSRAIPSAQSMIGT